MQIHRLALKNFKCFKEVDVSFSKITLLTGENSSGKSSLIYGILSPLQSVNEASYTSFPLYLSLNGNYVNMGGFEDVSFNHNQKIDFGIDLTVSLKKDSIRFNTFWFFDRLTKSIKLRYLEIKEKSVKAEIKQLEDLSYLVNIERENKMNHHIPSIDAVNILRNYSRNRNIEIVKQLEDSSYLVNIENIDTKDFHIRGFDELIGGWDNPSQGYFDSIFENSYINHDAFGYISSFRFQPDRTYYQSLTSNKVDKFGGGYIDQILDWADTQSKELYDLISILKDLKILAQ